jgi:hypothetical protein
MRCPDCNKFVAYGDGITDEIEVDMSDAALCISGRLVLPCSECSGELKELQIEESVDVADHFGKIDTKLDGEGKEMEPTVEYEVTDSNIEFTSRSQTTDRKGNLIKNPRYMKTFYGVEVTATVRRIVEWDDKDIEEEEQEVTVEVEEQASAFEELT